MFRSVCRIAMTCGLLAAGLAAQPAGGPAQKRVFPLGPGPRAGRQAALIERWSSMTPEQRRKALDRLPPERREKIEEQLNRYQNMTPEQRDQLRFRAQLFNQLPPESQDEARRLFRIFNQLPPERQGVVREEFRSLRSMPESDRLARVDSGAFRGAFNIREQRILRELSRLASPAAQ